MKLQEHRQKLDQHKLYLMHIAAEADIAEQQEDSVITTHTKPHRRHGSPLFSMSHTTLTFVFPMTVQRSNHQPQVPLSRGRTP